MYRLPENDKIKVLSLSSSMLRKTCWSWKMSRIGFSTITACNRHHWNFFTCVYAMKFENLVLDCEENRAFSDQPETIRRVCKDGSNLRTKCLECSNQTRSVCPKCNRPWCKNRHSKVICSSCLQKSKWYKCHKPCHMTMWQQNIQKPHSTIIYSVWFWKWWITLDKLAVHDFSSTNRGKVNVKIIDLVTKSIHTYNISSASKSGYLCCRCCRSYTASTLPNRYEQCPARIREVPNSIFARILVHIIWPISHESYYMIHIK